MSYKRVQLNFISKFLFFCFALTFGLTGCKAQQTDETNRQPEDPAITEAVTGDLISARGVDANLITIATEDGIVTLSGTTDNLLTKERASRVASSIKGVRSVVNEIEVVSDKSEDLINEDIQAALITDPATDKWQIRSSVENGVVTLSGTVESWQERDLTETVVKSVSGVVAVDNNITVELREERSDSQIREEIVSAMAWNNRLNAGLIDVSVTDGKVQLTGSVASLYEKSLATGISYVAGVEEVNNESIQVEPFLKEEMKRSGLQVNVTDEDIEEAITQAHKRHPRVNEELIKVSVDNNIATLSGTATNLKSARAAADIASNTYGVFSVDNELNVINEIVIVPDVNLTDEDIKEDVNAAFMRDPYINDLQIDISVDDGVVTLNGSAESHFQKFEADEVASRVNGVINVINSIQVDYTAGDYNSMFYDWNVIDYDFDYNQRSLSDAELKEAINRELFWSPFVTADSIEVTVENGVANLNGQVLSSFAVNEAINEAYEAGALVVNSDLKYL